MPKSLSCDNRVGVGKRTIPTAAALAAALSAISFSRMARDYGHLRFLSETTDLSTGMPAFSKSIATATPS
jgi:hypothetical protein